jgi:phytanoyl-CoA hydroxylase
MLLRRKRGLKSGQREAWNRDGFLVLSGLYSRKEIREAGELLDSIWRERRRPDNPLVVDTNLDGHGSRKYLRDAEDREKSTVYKLNDAYLEYTEVRDLSLKAELVDVLRELVEGDVCMCNSLHFERGSQQSLHVDTFYMPPPAGGVLIATSICLEDVHPEAGPLNYVTGSHLIPPFYNPEGGRHVRNAEEQDQAKWYYASAIRDRGMRDAPFLGKAGDVIIWHEQLLHGGSPIVDMSRTRKSLVSHYWRCAEMDQSVLQSHGSGFYMKRSHATVAS